MVNIYKCTFLIFDINGLNFDSTYLNKIDCNLIYNNGTPLNLPYLYNIMFEIAYVSFVINI